MSVKLRKRILKDGRWSFYLDINYMKKRWAEFLDIKPVIGSRNSNDKQLVLLAEEIRAKREHEILSEGNGLVNRQNRNINFIDYFQKTIQQVYTSGVIGHLKNFIGNKFLPISAIDDNWLIDFKNYLLERVSNNSALSYLNKLNTCLHKAVKNKIIGQNPFRDLAPQDKLKVKDTFRNFFSLVELEALANASVPSIHPQIKQAYLFSCFTGLRWSDINCLRWDEIVVKDKGDKKEYFIYYEQEKTENIEYLPLMQTAIELLETRREETKREITSPYVFPYLVESSPNSKRKYHKVNRALKKWAKAAGIKPDLLHFHSGRHSFATNVYENCPEVDIWMLKKLLGHRDIKSTMVYTMVRENRIKSALEFMPKFNLKGNTA